MVVGQDVFLIVRELLQADAHSVQLPHLVVVAQLIHTRADVVLDVALFGLFGSLLCLDFEDVAQLRLDGGVTLLLHTHGACALTVCRLSPFPELVSHGLGHVPACAVHQPFGGFLELIDNRFNFFGAGIV